LYLNVLYKKFAFTVCVFCKCMCLFYILTAFCMLALVAVLLHHFSALIHLYVLVLIFRCCYFIQPVLNFVLPMGWLRFLGT